MRKALPPGWSLGTLEDVLANIVAGTSANCEERPFIASDKHILKLSAISNGRLHISERKIVAQNEHSRLRTPVRKGKILFTRKNTPALVGDSAYVTQSATDTYLPDLVWELTAAKGVDPQWLNHWLQAPLFRSQIVTLAAGSNQSMVGISQASLLASPVLIPTIEEQRRIVAVLNTWDQSIDQTERLIAAKKTKFEQLRHHIFDELSRSSKSVCLSHILRRSPKIEPRTITGRRLLSVKLHCLGVVENESQIPRQTRNGRPYYERSAGDLIIGRQNFHNGGIGIVPPELDGFLASNAISSFEFATRKTNADYVYHYLARSSFYERVSVLMGGTGQKELSEEEFLSLKIPLPDVAIQEKIGRLFACCKIELDQFEKGLVAYVAQKRGLMQKLMTGDRLLDERFDAVAPVIPTAAGGVL